jgi:foldase protein PrsA
MLGGMRRIGLALIAGALLFAACGGDHVEATVNGTEIMTSDVEGFVYELSDIDRTPQQFAVYLGQAIQWEAVEQRVHDELQFEPTQDEIDLEVKRVVLNAGLLDIPSFLVQQNISEATLQRVAKHLVIQRHLHDILAPDIPTPTDEEVQQELDDNPARWVDQVCASHILLLTSDDADAAKARLDAGEDFRDLAIELSTDPGSADAGGSLGCVDPSGFVAEFADAVKTAPIGEVVGPIQTQYGYHLILVESRTTRPFEDVRTAIKEANTLVAVSEWLNDTVKAADVTVSEARGTWVTDPTPMVQPPAQLG